MSFVIVLVILFVLVLVISAPLRTARCTERSAGGELAELEAAREAKLREIRDAELDHRTGKLSAADFRALDATLRAEAIEILHSLDRVRERSSTEAPTASAS